MSIRVRKVEAEVDKMNVHIEEVKSHGHLDPEELKKITDDFDSLNGAVSSLQEKTEAMDGGMLEFDERIGTLEEDFGSFAEESKSALDDLTAHMDEQVAKALTEAQKEEKKEEEGEEQEEEEPEPAADAASLAAVEELRKMLDNLTEGVREKVK